MDKRTLTIAGCALALILFFAVNILARASLRSMRMDLTEDELFTLSDGSRQIAEEIEEPIHLYLYFSRKLARNYPVVRDYAERVIGFLEEFVRASDGKLRLQVIDPEPFSEEEDKAVEQGIQGAPIESGDSLYFGLVGTNATDNREVIPFFPLEQEKQRFLEYDLTKLIWTLAHPDKKKVGILSALALEGGGGNPMLGQPQQERWRLLEQLGDFFDTRVLEPAAEDLPDDLDVLVVIHPRGFGERTLYQIDQWALAGKPLLVFVDPHCEVDPGESDPSNPASRFGAERGSNLETLFKAWGLELVKNKVACDQVKGARMAVPNRERTRRMEMQVVYVLGLDKENVNAEDPVTSLLDRVLLSTSGALQKLADGTTQFTPLLQTSEESQKVDSEQFQWMPDAQGLLASFVPGFEKLTVAARVTGEVQSAFPGGPPGKPKDDEPKDPPEDGSGSTEEGEGETEEGEDPGAAAQDQGLSASSAPLNLIVVADVDMLHERWWMQDLGSIGGQPIVALISSNLDLLKNGIENLMGGDELISIRARGQYSRPFELVLAIRRDAEQRYLAEEQELEGKLRAAEQRLTELQRAKGQGTEELVTTEQRKEIEQAIAEKVQTRKDLRAVKNRLRRDIERLGTRLKWINIGVMPVLVSAAAIALGAWRIQRRGTK